MAWSVTNIDTPSLRGSRWIVWVAFDDGVTQERLRLRYARQPSRQDLETFTDHLLTVRNTPPEPDPVQEAIAAVQEAVRNGVEPEDIVEAIEQLTGV